jgi:hypothetical protein
MVQVAGDVYPIRYTADSFFFLHTINAYEEKDQVCFILSSIEKKYVQREIQRPISHHIPPSRDRPARLDQPDSGTIRIFNLSL